MTCWLIVFILMHFLPCNEHKKTIALALERMGVDVMEVGFPVSSPGDFESVQTIARIGEVAIKV
jgi:isopropylmalate/homocitrate/citramalate synthase